MRNNVAEEGILAGHVQHILFCVSGQVNEADTKRTRSGHEAEPIRASILVNAETGDVESPARSARQLSGNACGHLSQSVINSSFE